MRLSKLHESKIPNELKALSRNYWKLRNDAFGGDRMPEPYICNMITRVIGNFLRDHGFTIKYIRGIAGGLIHFWLTAERDGQAYEVDGSAYQFFYTKPIKGLINSQAYGILNKYGLDTLAGALAVIDYSSGLGTGWTDTDEYDIAFTNDDVATAAAEIGSSAIEHLKGNLLPLMLTINRTNTIQNFDHTDEVSDQELDF